MKKRGLFAFSLLLFFALAISMDVSAYCCANQAYAPYGTLCEEEDYIPPEICCPEGSDPECLDLNYTSETCDDLDACDDSCCIVEEGSQLGTCDFGDCLPASDYYVGENLNLQQCTLQYTESCVLGCCCGVMENDPPYYSVAYQYCDLIHSSVNLDDVWSTGIDPAQCNIFCDYESTSAACDNSYDDDGDGFCDYDGCYIENVFHPADIGCEDAADDNESNCGNYEIETPEQCEKISDEEWGTGCTTGCLCMDGYVPSDPLAADCTEIPSTCGDGVIEGTEQCEVIGGEIYIKDENGDQIPVSTCGDLGMGFSNDEPISCGGCKLDTSDCATCGNNLCENNEQTECPDDCIIPPVPECDDGIDNDGDGLIDFKESCFPELDGCDPACDSEDDIEGPACNENNVCDEDFETIEGCADCCPTGYGTKTWPTGEQCDCEYHTITDPEYSCVCEDIPDDGCPLVDSCFDGTLEGVCSTQYLGKKCIHENNLYQLEDMCGELPDCECDTQNGFVCNEDTKICEKTQEECASMYNGEPYDDDGIQGANCEDPKCYSGQICTESEYDPDCSWQADPENTLDFYCCMGGANDCDNDNGDGNPDTGVKERCGPCDSCGPTNANEPTDLDVIDVKFRPELQIKWAIEGCFNEVNTFKVLRCEATDDVAEGLHELSSITCSAFTEVGSIKPASPSMMDFYDTSLSEDYEGRTFCYTVKAVYDTTEKTFDNGQSVMCEELATKYCLRPDMPNAFCIYDGEPYSSGSVYICKMDDSHASNVPNLTIALEKNCTSPATCKFDPYDPSHDAVCYQGNACKMCNEPLGVFGIFSLSRTSFIKNGTTFDDELCKETLHCYYDKSNLTSVDYFSDCNATIFSDNGIDDDLGCYGYRDMASCEGFKEENADVQYNNKCLQRNCTWEWINEEFGVGICREIDEDLQKCELCSGDYIGDNDLQSKFNRSWNNVFGACTVEACSSFGHCFPKDVDQDGVIFDTSGTPIEKKEICLGREHTSCFDYTAEEATAAYCKDWGVEDNRWGTNEQAPREVVVDIKAGQWRGSNMYKNHSFDFFAFGYCNMVQDDGRDKCIDDPDFNGDSIVEKMYDRAPPSSYINTEPVVGDITDNITFTVQDIGEDGLPCLPAQNCTGVDDSQEHSGRFASMVRMEDEIHNDLEGYLYLNSKQPKYNGTISGAKFTVNGKKNGAYIFEDDSSSITIDGTFDELVDNYVTFAAWINMTDTPGQMIILQRSESFGGQSPISLEIDGQEKALFNIRSLDGTRYVVSDTVLQTGRWYLLVGTYDGTNLCIYVDGVPKCIQSYGDIVSSSTSVSYIGMTADNSLHFRGVIDEVGVWNISLSELHVKQLYNNGDGVTYENVPKPAGLIAYYKGDRNVTSLCYDYLECSHCLINRTLFDDDENNTYWITEDSFDGVCSDSPLPEHKEITACPVSSCYRYPDKKIKEGQGFSYYFGNYPGGHYNIYYYSKDVAGHLEEVKRLPLYLDNEGPEIWLEPDYIVHPGELPTDPEERLMSNVTLFVKINEYAYCWDAFDYEGDNQQSVYLQTDADQKKQSALFNESFTSNYGEYTDGIYDYVVNCTDYLNNSAQKIFKIRIKGDMRIQEVSPLVPVDRSRLNLTVVTANNVSCNISDALTEDPVWIQIPPENVTLGEDEEQEEVYIHRLETDLTHYNGSYFYNVMCDYIPVPAFDMIKFTLDQMAPVTYPQDEANAPYDFSVWKTDHYGVKLFCHDGPPEGNLTREDGFGCNETRYCISPVDCNTTYLPDEAYTVTQHITIPRLLCYSSSEKSSADYGEAENYTWLVKPQGGNIEDKECVWVNADEIIPELRIDYMESYKSLDLPFAPHIMYIEDNKYLMNGSILDWDYDTDSETIGIDRWKVAPPPPAVTKIKIMEPEWVPSGAAGYTKEGYSFKDMTMNFTFKLREQVDRPNFIYMIIRAANDDNFTSASIKLMPNNEARLMIHRSTNGQMEDIETSDVFIMRDATDEKPNMTYYAYIKANGTNIKFDVYGNEHQLLQSLSTDEANDVPGYIGTGISGLKKKIDPIRVKVEDLNLEANNKISYTVFETTPPYDNLTSQIKLVLPENESLFNVNVSLQGDVNPPVYRIQMAAQDKAENENVKSYYLYIDRNGPFFTEFKFKNGANVNESHYEMFSSDNETFVLKLKDTDFRNLHVNVSSVVGSINDHTYPFRYVRTTTSGGQNNQIRTYTWNVTVNASDLGMAGQIPFEINATDELGNMNSTVYYINVSDTTLPRFDIRIFRDLQHLEETSIVGLGMHYVSINSSEPAMINYLNFTASFNNFVTPIYIGAAYSNESQEQYYTTWNGTFMVPQLGFYGMNGTITFVLNSTDRGGNFQNETSPMTYPFVGEGPNNVIFDPSLAYIQHSPYFYHIIYPDMLSSYSEKYQEIPVFITNKASLFFTGFAFGAEYIVLNAGSLSETYEIEDSSLLEDVPPILSQPAPLGSHLLRFGMNLAGTEYADLENSVGFKDTIFRKSYGSYKKLYNITNFTSAPTTSQLEVEPGLEQSIPAGEKVFVYDNDKLPRWFGLESPGFSRGYNEFYALAFDNNTYTSTPLYFIMFDGDTPEFMEGSYFPYDGLTIGNDEFTNITMMLRDKKPSSLIVGDTVIMNITYKPINSALRKIYSGPVSIVDYDHEDGLYSYFNAIFLLSDVSYPNYPNLKKLGGLYNISVDYSDRASNNDSYTWSFMALNGSYMSPRLLLVNNSISHNNSYDLYPYPESTYFTNETSTGFELRFVKDVFTLSVQSNFTDVNISCIPLQGSLKKFHCTFSGLDSYSGMPEAIQKLNITATNSDSNSTNWNYQYVVDSHAPTIENVDLYNRVRSNSTGPNVNVTLDVEDESFDINISMFLINSTDSVLVGSGITSPVSLVEFFGMMLPENISEGTYTLQTVATDQAGNRYYKETQIIVDNTPPELQLISVNPYNEHNAVYYLPVEWENSTSPNITDYAYSTNDTVIKVSFSSSEQLASVCYTVWPSSITCDYTRETPSSMENIVLDVMLVSLSQTTLPNEITITAFDLSGNEKDIEIPIYTDNAAPYVVVNGDLRPEKPLSIYSGEYSIISSYHLTRGNLTVPLRISRNSSNHYFELLRNGIMFNGTYRFVADVKDVFGHTRKISYPFAYTTESFMINMTNPIYGWSSTPLTNITIEPNRASTCRYGFNPLQAYSSMPYEMQFVNSYMHTVENFSITAHAQIYVICQDQYGQQSPLSGARRFNLTYNPNAPVINQAYADPSTVVDETMLPGGSWTLMTTLVVGTDIPSTCRYSSDTSNYSLMQNTFPGIGASHKANVTNLPPVGDFVYNVGCSSLAGIVGDSSQITFNVDTSQSLRMTVNAPIEYVTSNKTEQILLNLSTNKAASCRYNINNGSWSQFVSQQSKKHITKINPPAGGWTEGWRKVYFNCSIQNADEYAAASGSFALDLTAPTVHSVDLANVTCRKDRIVIMYINATDSISKVDVYAYKLIRSSDAEVVINWTETNDEEDIRVDEFSNGTDLELEEDEPYHFFIKAKNSAVKEFSAEFKTHTIIYDSGAKQCAKCGDGICNNRSESCLNCPSDCRPCTSGCANNIKDGTESDKDCGGSCAKCVDGKNCGSDSDCISGNCDSGKCKPSLCANGIWDISNGETDIDCGHGECSACGLGKKCQADSDCIQPNYCDPAMMICTSPTCDDGLPADNEADIDCGGVCLLEGLKCAEGSSCTSNEDCDTGFCKSGICEKSSCDDSILNGDETDADCGGICKKCGEGDSCEEDSDCASNICEYSRCKADDAEKDTDGDGMPDLWEVQNGLNPNDPSDKDADKDEDGLSNFEEYQNLYRGKYRTKANNADSDGDGVPDKKEIEKGTDPTDSSSFPKSTSWWSLLLLILLIAALLGGGGYYVYATYFEDKRKGPPGNVQGSFKAYDKKGASGKKGMFSQEKLNQVSVQQPKRESIFRSKEQQKQVERSKLLDSFSDKPTKVQEIKPDFKSDLKPIAPIHPVKSEDSQGFKKPELKGEEWIEVGQTKEDLVSRAFRRLSNLTSRHKSEFERLESLKDKELPEIKVDDEKKTLKEKVTQESDAFKELKKISPKGNEDAVEKLSEYEKGEEKPTDVFQELKKINKK